MSQSQTKKAVLAIAILLVVFGVGFVPTACFAAGEAAVGKVVVKAAPQLIPWLLNFFFGLGGVAAFIALVTAVWNKPTELQQVCAVPAAGCGLLQAYGWFGTPWKFVQGIWPFSSDRYEWSTATFLGYLFLAGIAAAAFLAIIGITKTANTTPPKS